MMKKHYVVSIIIFSFTVSALCLATGTSETKKSQKSNELSKEAKPKQGDKFTNSIGMEFMYIAPGKFKMGSKQSPEELAEQYREPLKRLTGENRHKVKLTKGFFLQTTEATKSQFSKFVSAKNYITDAEKGKGAYILKKRQWILDPNANWQSPGFEQDDNHPVTCISWNDAKAFCEWLNEEDKSSRYRLPTEAEWEYACRAGGTSIFPWGDKADDVKGWCNAADLTSQKVLLREAFFNWDDGFVYTSPAAQFKSNAWGLYDMLGNVSEWCEDWRDDEFYEKAEARKDPCNETFGEKKYRVLGGGSWLDHPAYCRSAVRGGGFPDYGNSYFGFRVVREQKNSK